MSKRLNWDKYRKPGAYYTEFGPGVFRTLAPATFSVDLLTYQHRGMEYGAGRVYLSLGGRSLGPSVAVTVLDERSGEREKWVTTPEAAHRWLTQRGLPYAVASELLAAVAA